MPLFFAFMLSGCGSSAELASAWSSGNVVVDGQSSDWDKVPLYTGKEKVGVSVSNDNEFLYVYLTTQDRQTQMQIMRFGLTVWLDRKDSKDETFGIHYPLGMRFNEPLTDRSRSEGGEGMQRALESQSRELEILGPGKNERRRLSLLAVPGVQAKIAFAGSGNLVYELRVPLKENSNYQFAVNAEGSKIGVGISSQADKEAMKERTGPPEEGVRRGESGGGMRGGGTRGGGGGVRRGGGEMASRPSNEPLDLWLSVTLASTPR
ncbi:MAG: hypothetical protein ABI623_04630 [bacterium]